MCHLLLVEGGAVISVQVIGIYVLMPEFGEDWTMHIQDTTMSCFPVQGIIKFAGHATVAQKVLL